MCYKVCIETKDNDKMNTQEIIKEIRKSGKVAILMSSTEMEILVDKSDLIEVIKSNESADSEYEIYERAGLGYRCVFYSGAW